MDDIYANVEYDKPVDSTPRTNQTGPSSPRSRPHVAVAVSLGLLSVLLLAGLVCLGVHAAELSSIKANLTERLQVSGDKLSSVSAERDQLKDNFTALTQEKDGLQLLLKQMHASAAELSSIKANLAERLRVSGDKLSSVSAERDQLKDKVTALTQEKDRLQLLLKQMKTCPEGWTMFRCSCYLLSTRDDSWEKGRKDCRDQGADLVIIDSLEEQKFLSNFTTSRSWIGLSDKDIEGTWKWIDGTPLTAAYWFHDANVAQPDNGGGNPQWGEEDCADIEPKPNPQYSWNDLSCNTTMRWICEKLA